MNADDRLREILHAEAERVQTSPAAYDAIKTKFARSRRRVGWQRAMLATATAAAVAITAVVVVDSDSDKLVVDPPAASPSASTPASPQPSPTESLGPVPTADEHVNAVWPHTTRSAIAAWTPAAEPRLSDPGSAAAAYIRALFGVDPAWKFSGVRVAEPRVAEVDVERSYGDSSPNAKVTTVTLRAFGESENEGPWLVTQALTPGIVITSPEHGSTVTSPVTMSGTVVGIHHSVHAQVRAADGASLGEAHEMAGEEVPWSTQVTFGTDKPVASVTATLRSDRDGEPTSFTAVPVRRASPPKGQPPAPTPPETFVAVQGGRLALIRTTTGERVRYLTTEQPGGGVAHPEMAPDGTTVYFVRAHGTCAASINAVSTTNQTERTVVSLTGMVPAYLSISGDGRSLAYVRIECSGDDPEDWSIVVRDLNAAKERAWSSSASAPESGSVGDLAINETGSKVYFLHNSCCGDLDPFLKILDTTAPGEVLEEHSTRPAAWDSRSCGILTGLAVSTSYPDVVVNCAGAESTKVVAVRESGAVEALFTSRIGGWLDFVHGSAAVVMSDGSWWMPGRGPVVTAANGVEYATW